MGCCTRCKPTVQHEGAYIWLRPEDGPSERLQHVMQLEPPRLHVVGTLHWLLTAATLPEAVGSGCRIAISQRLCHGCVYQCCVSPSEALQHLLLSKCDTILGAVAQVHICCALPRHQESAWTQHQRQDQPCQTQGVALRARLLLPLIQNSKARQCKAQVCADTHSCSHKVKAAAKQAFCRLF
jgi:hypothetical protein